jgi:hypothetical protein
MILLVLLIIFAGLFLLGFIAFWVLPRLSARLQMPEWLLVTCVALFMFVAFLAYVNSSVECPFCHAGNVDAQGLCRLGNRCPNFYHFPKWSTMSDKDRNNWTGNPGHHKAETCYRCSQTGRITRLDTWDDWID